MAENEQRPECKENFNRLWERLEKGDNKMNEHDVGITELRTNVTNLTKSMDALTKAIWGAVIAIAGFGIGFFIWFVQTKI